MSATVFAARGDEYCRRTLEQLPAAAYTCDPDGLITYFNEQAFKVWGRAPRLNDPLDRFCGSLRLYAENNQLVAHEDCWMALAIRNRRPYLGQEIVVERPDGSRLTVLAYATPMFDPEGNVVAALNMLVNISERKRTESLLAEANRANGFYRATLAEALREEIAPMCSTLAELEALIPRCAALEGPVAKLQTQIAQMQDLVNDLVDVKDQRTPEVGA